MSADDGAAYDLTVSWNGVTEAMVRAASREFWDGNPEFMAEHAADMRAALEAALAVGK